MQKKLLTFSWGIISILIFLYSYTQIDLSLTFSRASLFQTIEKAFQYVGYFNRPLSTYLYIGIILLSSIAYIYTLIQVKKGKINRKYLWTIIILMTVVLAFSYTAFTYDLFNYIFDAKIITHYMQNPYEHKALDYPHDPMLSFMHWTHRTYPYGPVWLLLTVPLSYLGLGYFIVTFYLFKMLAAVSFLATAFYIEKISKKIKSGNELFSLALFALNPFVIVEGLVSGHLDMVMMAFCMISMYLLFNGEYIKSGIVWLLSVGVKFATGFLFPIFLLFTLRKSLLKNYKDETIIFIGVILMALSVIVASLRTNFQPWYLLDVLPFAFLLPKKKYIIIPSIIISLGALLQYIPFLFTGNWDPPIPQILTFLLFGSIIISILYIIVSFFRKSFEE